MKLSKKAIAQMIEDNTDVITWVRDTWIDYEAGIHQDQILVINKDENQTTYQLLTPRELDEVEQGIYTIEQVQEHIDEINERKW